MAKDSSYVLPCGIIFPSPLAARPLGNEAPAHRLTRRALGRCGADEMPNQITRSNRARSGRADDKKGGVQFTCRSMYMTCDWDKRGRRHRAGRWPPPDHRRGSAVSRFR